MRKTWFPAICFLLVFSCLGWAQLVSRDPADRMPPPSTPNPYGNRALPNEVPEGYRFLVTLDDKLDTRNIQAGKHFKAKIQEAILSPGGQVIPIGKRVKGHVSAVERGFHARLLLSFDEIQTSHGWVPLAATVVETPGEKLLRTPGPEGEIERTPVDKKRAIVSATVGALIGASAGAAAGGGRGAAIGAAVGAGAGTGAGILSDRDIRLDKGAQLVLRLDRAVLIP